MSQHVGATRCVSRLEIMSRRLHASSDDELLNVGGIESHVLADLVKGNAALVDETTDEAVTYTETFGGLRDIK